MCPDMFFLRTTTDPARLSTYNMRVIVVAVVDRQTPEYAENLEAAVRYTNALRSPVLPGHELGLDVIISDDDDSFGAMDQGEERGDGRPGEGGWGGGGHIRDSVASLLLVTMQ